MGFNSILLVHGNIHSSYYCQMLLPHPKFFLKPGSCAAHVGVGEKRGEEKIGLFLFDGMWQHVHSMWATSPQSVGRIMLAQPIFLFALPFAAGWEWSPDMTNNTNRRQPKRARTHFQFWPPFPKIYCFLKDASSITNEQDSTAKAPEPFQPHIFIPKHRRSTSSFRIPLSLEFLPEAPSRRDQCRRL